MSIRTSMHPITTENRLDRLNMLHTLRLNGIMSTINIAYCLEEVTIAVVIEVVVRVVIAVVVVN